MELIPGKRYEWCIYAHINPDDVTNPKFLRNGLFTAEYDKNGSALLITREGEEWSVPVENLRKWRKK